MLLYAPEHLLTKEYEKGWNYNWAGNFW